MGQPRVQLLESLTLTTTTTTTMVLNIIFKRLLWRILSQEIILCYIKFDSVVLKTETECANNR